MQVTDLEIIRLCAEAMGIPIDGTAGNGTAYWAGDNPDRQYVYDPLNKDAQAMALVKKFHLAIEYVGPNWHVGPDAEGPRNVSEDLNHVICECVAKMQQAKP